MDKITEQSSSYRHLEQMSTRQLLENINNEDQRVPHAVSDCIPQIEAVIDVIVDKMEVGGRLFYIGAGTSGRLGILDASECPPTFGVPHDWVIALMAGGDQAIRQAVEFAEDDKQLAWKDLKEYDVNEGDVVVGIAASGTTPYVIHGLKTCQQNNIVTACITCNIGSPLESAADYPIVCVVGPEFVTGSTRMKSGTAQKLILNMITTSTMIRLGRVMDNKMVDMQLSNNKLVDRGTRLVAARLKINYEQAKDLLLTHGSVRKALDNY